MGKLFVYLNDNCGFFTFSKEGIFKMVDKVRGGFLIIFVSTFFLKLVFF